MEKESIKFSIKQDGRVTQEVFNVPGDACLNLTEDVEVKLGDLEQRVYTCDYFNTGNLNEDIVINTEDVTL